MLVALFVEQDLMNDEIFSKDTHNDLLSVIESLRKYEHLSPLSSLPIHPETPGWTTGGVLRVSRDAISMLENMEKKILQMQEELNSERESKHYWEIERLLFNPALPINPTVSGLKYRLKIQPSMLELESWKNKTRSSQYQILSFR